MTMNKSDVYIAKMVLTYLAIICKSRKHNMVQWYGDGGGGGGGGEEKINKCRSDHKSQ